MFEFVSSYWLWGILLVIPYLIWEIFYHDKKRLRFPYNRIQLLKSLSATSSWMRFIPFILRSLLIASLFIAVARPRLANQKQKITSNGIDIVLAIDISGSMKAVDFRPTNRLEAAKKVATEFIKKRMNDQLGIIVFSDHAFTQCPLTLDYNMLMTILNKIEIDEEAQGTAIGMGLATAVARLKDSKAESKVIILITDGRDNTGNIDPLTAANLAATFDIKIYPIGVGKKGLVDFPFGNGYRKVNNVGIDLDKLNEIARIGGTGRARLARNTKEFEEIMNMINDMEKTKIEIKNYYEYKELFHYWLWFALLLLMVELYVKYFILKQLP